MQPSSASPAIHTVEVGLGERAYPIRIGPGLIDRLGEEAAALFCAGAPGIVLTNDQLAPSWGERARAALLRAGIDARLFAVPEGESHKSMPTLNLVLDYLVETRAPRQTVLFAVGGGVVGDMAGFAAAIYMRGVPYVQVPTSLLAMVDSSVGGKTAVNHAKGKNLIGAFYQPRLVAADLAALETLPDREFRTGLAEMIKHGVIRDAALFETLEREMPALLRRDYSRLGPAVLRNCEIKAAVVEADERETGLRAILNYGHTLGHAVENLASKDGMLHGEAVAIGMAAAGAIAVKMGLWSAAEAARVEALIRAAGLPARIPPLDREALMDRMARDKKAVGTTLRFVLPEAIGRVAIRDDVPGEVLAETIEEMMQA